jgi:hypothetical protein
MPLLSLIDPNGHVVFHGPTTIDSIHIHRRWKDHTDDSNDCLPPSFHYHHPHHHRYHAYARWVMISTRHSDTATTGTNIPNTTRHRTTTSTSSSSSSFTYQHEYYHPHATYWQYVMSSWQERSTRPLFNTGTIFYSIFINDIIRWKQQSTLLNGCPIVVCNTSVSFLPDFTEHPKPRPKRRKSIVPLPPTPPPLPTPPPTPPPQQEPPPSQEDEERISTSRSSSSTTVDQDLDEGETSVSFWHDFVAGGVAGSASVIVGHVRGKESFFVFCWSECPSMRFSV